MNHKFLTLFGTSLLILLAASPTIADDKKSTVDYARVTSVEPIYRYVTVEKPHRQCRYVRVNSQHRNQHRQSHNGQHNGGRHNNGQRRFVSGESITNNNSRRSTSGRSHTNNINSVESLRRHQSPNSRLFNRRQADNHQRNTPGSNHNRLVERCVTTTVSHEERHHDGYNVTYVYRGKTYYTRTDQHPGEKIRVLVQVKPY